MPTELLRILDAQWAVLAKAPIVFLATVLLALGLAYSAARWRYKGQLESVKARCETVERQLEATDRAVSELRAKAPTSLQPAAAEGTDHVFETTDYVKHVLSHRLPLVGVRIAFEHSKSIDDLAQSLSRLSENDIDCPWFSVPEMKAKYLTPINISRKALGKREFGPDEDA